MKLIYEGKKYRIFSKVRVPQKKGQYVYFLRIGDKKNRFYKIGTTDDIMRRMKEHCAKYKEEIYILWVSPNYSKYTTLRIEDRQKDYWKTLEGFTHVPNDRFYFPEWITSITIKVKKEYKIDLD